MTDYAVKLTDLAAAIGGVELEQIVRDEIAKLLEDGLSEPLTLFFHTFEYRNQEFVCYPRDGAMEVDTCYRESMGTENFGKIGMPRGESGQGP